MDKHTSLLATENVDKQFLEKQWKNRRKRFASYRNRWCGYRVAENVRSSNRRNNAAIACEALEQGSKTGREHFVLC